MTALPRSASLALQALVIAGACWWLSPLDTRTVLAASAEYVRTTGFGPYDRLVYSHVQRRPFEVCGGADLRHSQVLDRVFDALPAIEASSSYELVRLFRLIRTFNRESQTFYATPCAEPWTYFYSYVDYQSGLMKIAPSLWLIDVFHRSEIYIVVALIAGSWFGVFCLYWLALRLTGSVIVAMASLGGLWIGLWFFGPSLYADLRLNLLNTFTLIAVAQFLMDRPDEGRWTRRLLIEIAAALVFAIAAVLLMFLRMPSTRLDATVAMVVLFIVAVLRWNATILRRAVLLFIVVTAVLWPYRTYSKGLLAPVAAVNSAEAEEYKVVNAVQFLTERPTHFGNFILDFNFTWMFDADYYLRQLSPVPALHHGFPAWGNKFLKETVFHHAWELPNSWWRRFAVQVTHHEQLSNGVYKAHPRLGTVLLWVAVLFMFVMLSAGRGLTSSWPLAGLVFWEVFGLHTFLGLMHVHSVYLAKGLPLMWCALPVFALLAGRELMGWWSRRGQWSWPQRPQGRALWITIAATLVAVSATWFVVREYRKEWHATRVWRAVHVGQYFKESYLSPDALVAEVEAIDRLGGDEPGTVHMYGAWALFGYLERIAAYRQVSGEPIEADHVKQLLMQLYQRALAEAPDNPHFYIYAYYFQDPDFLKVFRAALDRFPDHPYSVMMSQFVASQDMTLSGPDRQRYQVRYEDSVRRQLRASASYRPSLVEFPSLSAGGPIVRTPDGVGTTLLPGETATLQPFHTFGTDRLTIGLFLKVTQGAVTAQLNGQPNAKLGINETLTVPATDAIHYRAWHFTDVAFDRLSSRTATSAVTLTAGPEGARFVVRDFYPIVENPRWFR